MKELKSVNQKVYIQDNFLNIEQIQKYINKIIPFPCIGIGNSIL